ncbi:18783_t:CDS:2, partial [Funneliformis geosporum]
MERGLQRQNDDFLQTIDDENAFYFTDLRTPINGVSLFYAPIWISDEIWILWKKQWKNIIIADHVQELMNKWDSISRLILNKSNDELNIEELTFKCNIKSLIKTLNGRGLQHDNFNNKIIHIHSKPDFKNKVLKFVFEQIAKKLYHKHALVNWMEIIHLIEE